MPIERLILPERASRDYSVLANACGWLGIDVLWIDRFSLDGLPLDCPLDGTALHGGTTFCREVAATLGGQVLEPPDDFLPSLPENLRKRQVELTTLTEARSRTDLRFVKPVNDKFFTAGVYEWPDDIPRTDKGDEIAVLVADPVTWLVEYRLFVLDGAIKAISPYLWAEADRPDLSTQTEAVTFGASVLDEAGALLPRAVVVDVGIIDGAGWAVVEANTAVMSGIYDCEPEAVLEVIAAGMEPV